MNKELSNLAFVLKRCNDEQKIEEFLQTLLTPKELADICKRWALVKLLAKGQTQRAISKELGISLCKITRGSKELQKESSIFKEFIKIEESKK